MTKLLIGSVPLLRDRVYMESTSLCVNARHFVTLSTLYEMTRALLSKQTTAPDLDEAAAVADLARVWAVLTEVIGEWQLIVEGREHPAYLRQRYLHLHGVGRQAIAVAVARVRHRWPTSRAERRRGLWIRPWWQRALRARLLSNRVTFQVREMDRSDGGA